jgi:hypothetical protein
LEDIVEVAFHSIDFQDGTSGWVHTLISNIVPTVIEKPRHWEIVDITKWSIQRKREQVVVLTEGEISTFVIEFERLSLTM